MPKPRAPENRGFPKGWRFKNGAYYYAVPKKSQHYWDGKQLFRLGKSISEAYKEWSKRIDRLDKVSTIGQLLEKYEREVVPFKKTPKGRSDAGRYCKVLRAVLGEASIYDMKPHMVYTYVSKRSAQAAAKKNGKTGITAAKREIELLSHAFTKAVEWGFLDRHPFKGEVRIENDKPRDRYVEDWEIRECFKLKPARGDTTTLFIQAYIKVKVLIGLRQGDMLRIKIDYLKDDGIHVTPSKTVDSTGKKLIFIWSPELRAAVKEALALRPVGDSEWLFCNKYGECYARDSEDESSGFRSAWRRFMKRLIKETDVKVSFTEHDLRAKTGSDAKSKGEASRLLGHANEETTEKYYRRKAEVLEPLR